MRYAVCYSHTGFDIIAENLMDHAYNLAVQKGMVDAQHICFCIRSSCLANLRPDRARSMLDGLLEFIRNNPPPTAEIANVHNIAINKIRPLVTVVAPASPAGSSCSCSSSYTY